MLQKAMVFTLTAAMLVGTPLTASARGLTDLFYIENNKGEFKTGTGTTTGTVTGTETSTLDWGENDIAGLVLNETDVELEKGEDELLEVTIATYDNSGNAVENKELTEKFAKNFTWKSSDNSVVSVVLPWKVNSEKYSKDEKTDKMFVRAKKGGKAKVTVSLDDFANDIHYSVVADVRVSQWATEIKLDAAGLDRDAYSGDSLDLKDYTTLYPEEANDQVTYTVIGQSATLKGSVLTFKKLTSKMSKEVTVIAQGMNEEVRDEATFTINDSVPATTFNFSRVDGEKLESIGKTGFAWSVNEYKAKDGLDFQVDMKGKGDAISTDGIASWTSSKPAIVEVGESSDASNDPVRKNNQRRIHLIAKGVGTAQITAKTTSGKSGKLKVVVSADLTGIKIDVSDVTLYSGQSVELTDKLKVVQEFGDGNDNFTDAGLKWEFIDSQTPALSKKDMGKLATVSKTGLLTVKPDLSPKGVTNKQLKLKVSNAKKIGKTGAVGSKYAETGIISLKQVNIKNITVYRGLAEGTNNIIAEAHVDSKNGRNSVKNDVKNKKETISLDGNKQYKIVAVGEIAGSGEEVTFEPTDALGWTSSSTKVATANKNGAIGTVKAVKKGNATITICGSYDKGGNKYAAIKASFKVNVTQPTKSLTLTTKNTVLPNKKSQSVAIKAVLDKGTTTKAKDIQWSVVRKRDGALSDPIALTNGKLPLKNDVEDVDVSNGKLKAVGSKVGDQFIVTAKIPSAGISKTITFTIVTESKKASVSGIKDKDGNDVTIDKNKVTLQKGKTYSLSALINEDDKVDTKNVTYTVSKPGYVFIVGNQMVPYMTGTGIKITPVTPDGKKGTAITVTITD